MDEDILRVAIQGYFGFGTYCLGLVGSVFVASSVYGVAQSVHLGTPNS